MGRFLEFEAISQDSRTDSPCKNSSKIFFPNVNQMRRRSTTKRRPRVIRDESNTGIADSDNNDNIDDGYNDSNKFTSNVKQNNATQQSEALGLVRDQLKKIH